MANFQVAFVNSDGSVLQDGITVNVYTNDSNHTLTDSAVIGVSPSPTGQGVAAFTNLQPGITYSFEFPGIANRANEVVTLPSAPEIVLGPQGIQGPPGVMGPTGYGSSVLPNGLMVTDVVSGTIGAIPTLPFVFNNVLIQATNSFQIGTGFQITDTNNVVAGYITSYNPENSTISGLVNYYSAADNINSPTLDSTGTFIIAASGVINSSGYTNNLPVSSLVTTSFNQSFSTFTNAQPTILQNVTATDDGSGSVSITFPNYVNPNSLIVVFYTYTMSATGANVNPNFDNIWEQNTEIAVFNNNYGVNTTTQLLYASGISGFTFNILDSIDEPTISYIDAYEIANTAIVDGVFPFFNISLDDSQTNTSFPTFSFGFGGNNTLVLGSSIFEYTSTATPTFSGNNNILVTNTASAITITPSQYGLGAFEVNDFNYIYTYDSRSFYCGSYNFNAVTPLQLDDFYVSSPLGSLNITLSHAFPPTVNQNYSDLVLFVKGNQVNNFITFDVENAGIFEVGEMVLMNETSSSLMAILQITAINGNTISATVETVVSGGGGSFSGNTILQKYGRNSSSIAMLTQGTIIPQYPSSTYTLYVDDFQEITPGCVLHLTLPGPSPFSFSYLDCYFLVDNVLGNFNGTNQISGFLIGSIPLNIYNAYNSLIFYIPAGTQVSLAGDSGWHSLTLGTPAGSSVVFSNDTVTVDFGNIDGSRYSFVPYATNSVAMIYLDGSFIDTSIPNNQAITYTFGSYYNEMYVNTNPHYVQIKLFVVANYSYYLMDEVGFFLNNRQVTTIFPKSYPPPVITSFDTSSQTVNFTGPNYAVSFNVYYLSNSNQNRTLVTNISGSSSPSNITPYSTSVSTNLTGLDAIEITCVYENNIESIPSSRIYIVNSAYTW